MIHQEEVILTKDNLLKRNWNGNKSYVFCSKDATIEHLFLECLHAKFLWRAIHFVLGLKPTLNEWMPFMIDTNKKVDQVRHCYYR